MTLSYNQPQYWYTAKTLVDGYSVCAACGGELRYYACTCYACMFEFCTDTCRGKRYRNTGISGDTKIPCQLCEDDC